MKRRAPARLLGQSVTALAFDLGRNRDAMALGKIEFAFYRNAVAAREQLHIFHRRLDVNAVGGDLTGIDSVAELDLDRRFFEWSIVRDDPFNFERHCFTRGQNF